MNRTQQIFLGALELPDSQQEAWIEAQCGDDTSLLDDVRCLIAHDKAPHTSLDAGLTQGLLAAVGLTSGLDTTFRVRCPDCRQPIAWLGSDDFRDLCCDACGSHVNLVHDADGLDETEFGSRMIGHFSILAHVGAGGFANVYRAMDTQLDRIVAIKVPRKGQLTAHETELFFREARTAAQLKHPHIVSVHEVGLDRGVVYIVSDFINGHTLCQRMQEQRWTPQDAVQLVRKIALALAHAHTHGVVHRDLKPSNVMLDPESEPYLTDFGLAKRDAGEVTMTICGQVLGTPAYMSPEQASGDGHQVDGRTDVYSLGVILFELLTGERPFRGNTQAVLQQVLHDEAPNPIRHNALIPLDLATICLKCLEKSPKQRYATAALLADDLLRFLEHRPITARPVNRLEKAWRLSKRNPVAALLSMLLLVALLSGTAVSTYFGIKANSEAQKLAQSLATEQNLVVQKNTLLSEKESLIRDLSASTLAERAAKDAAITRTAEMEAVISFFREHVLSANRPEGQQGGHGIDTTVAEAMDEAEPMIAKSFQGQPSVESTIRQTLGGTYDFLGLYAKSLGQYQRAVELDEATYGVDAPETLPSLVGFIRAQRMTGKLNEALRRAQHALSVATQRLGPDDVVTLQLTNLVGQIHDDLGHERESIELFQVAFTKLDRTRGASDLHTLAALDHLASAYRRSGQLHEALVLYQRGLESAESQFGAGHVETLVFLQGLATTCSVSGRANEAIRYYERACEINRVKLGEQHPRTIESMSDLALLYQRAGLDRDAIETMHQSLRLATANLGEDHSLTFAITQNLAEALAHEQRWEESARVAGPMIERAQQKLGREHPDVCRWSNHQATVLAQLGRTDEALEARNPLLRYNVAKHRQPASSPTQLAFALAQYGRNLLSQHSNDEAIEVLGECERLYREHAPHRWPHFDAMTLYGEALSRAERFPQAEPMLVSGYQGLVDHLDSLPDYTPVDFETVLERIAHLYQTWDASRAAVWTNRLAEYRHARSEAERHRAQAAIHAEAGELQQAIEVFEQAEQLPWQRAVHGLAQLYARSAQWDKAVTAFEHAFPTTASFQRLCVLFRQGRIDDYQHERRLLLANYTSVDYKWQYFHDLQMSLLVPLEDELEIPVRYLAAVNENRTSDPACVAIVGKAMYRLGEFPRWFESLGVDSPLRQGQELLVALTRFQQTPSARNRSELVNEIDRQETQARDCLNRNLYENSWPEYVERMAWIHEARSALMSGDEESATVVEHWPDDDVDLLAMSVTLASTRKAATQQLGAEDIRGAIASFEAIAKIPGQIRDPMLVDLYARTMQWDRALELLEASPMVVDWRLPLVLDQLQESERCRDAVTELLTNPSYRSHPSYAFRHARGACLVSVDDELRDAVGELAALNSQPEVKEAWRRVLVAPLVYRLGEFPAWFRSHQSDASLVRGSELIAAMSSFRESANEETRQVLQREYVQAEAKMRARIDKGDLGVNWPDHVWRMAFLREAQALLQPIP